jgi:transcription termination factor NusB
VIDEAVTLAKTLSTDDSGGYVNGVLESVRKDIAATRQRSPSA